jgi:hypothetical protein
MKRIYVDMDGVLCDFFSASRKARKENPDQKFPQSQWGFFLKLPEIENAIESVNILKEKYDVWILTRPSIKNVNCFTEKAQWIWDHLGFDMLEKLIISSDKSLLKGDYLIDDQNNANQDKFEGTWIEFGSNKFPDWIYITKYLLNQLDVDKQKFCEYLIGKNKSLLTGYDGDVRMFGSTGSTKPDLKINFNRLNIRLNGDVIDYAYFG